MTFLIVQALLSEAEASWAAYRRDELFQCRSLLEAGRWDQAHSLILASVGPALLLAGRGEELGGLLRSLQLGQSTTVDTGDGVAASDWNSGAAVYLSFLDFVARQKSDSNRDASDDARSVTELLERLQAAGERMLSSTASSDAATKDRPDGCHLRLRQQLALSHMARVVHSSAVGRGLAPTASVAALPRLEAMQGILSLGCLPSELRMAGITAAATAVSSILV